MAGALVPALMMSLSAAPDSRGVGIAGSWAPVAPESTTAWTAAKVPLPANADLNYSQLGPVSCPTSSACTAGGSYSDSAGDQAFLLIRAKSSWTALQAPLPSDAAVDPKAHLDYSACFSASSCAVTGGYYDAAGVEHGVVLTGSGSSWTSVETPAPPSGGSGASIAAVTCVTASSCVAVGEYVDTAGTQEALLLTGFGSSWTAVQAPLPANASTSYQRASISAVTCPSASRCLAFGQYFDESGAEQVMALTGFGPSWTVVETPLPADAGSQPNAIVAAGSCTSRVACIGVGRYDNAAGAQEGLILTGYGKSWAALTSPVPGNAAAQPDTDLRAMTCLRSGSCVAVGDYSSTSGQQALLMTGSGSSWTATQSPLPPNTAASALGSVACTSAPACAAGGQYQTGNAVRPLVVTGAGSSWSVTGVPLPRNASNGSASIATVACSFRTTTCAATGNYVDQKGQGQASRFGGPA